MKLQKAHISCPRRKPASRNYCSAFERWCGRCLDKASRRIISVLERQRIAKKPMRLIVCAVDGESDATKKTLADYARYLLTFLDKDNRLPVYLVAPRREDARNLVPKRKPHSRKDDFSGSASPPAAHPRMKTQRS